MGARKKQFNGQYGDWVDWIVYNLSFEYNIQAKGYKQMSKSRILPSLQKVNRHSSKLSQVAPQLSLLMPQIMKVIPLGQNPITELQLKWKEQEDYEQLKYILQDILEFPSVDMADMHRDSNRLGILDILENQSMLSKILFQEGEPEIYCPCCGYLLQSDEIPLATSLRNIGNLGVSTHLYFQSITAISVLLSVLFLVYGIFALATNVIAFNNQANRQIVNPQVNYLTVSLSSKQLDQTQDNKKYYLVQCWLGLAVVILWDIGFILVKYFEKNDEILIDSRTISASDFSVVIEGVPTQMSQQQLQKQLDAYYSSLTEQQKPKQIDRPPKIAKFNSAVPFYLTLNEFVDTALKKTINQKNRLREQFVKWIMERQQQQQFSVPKDKRLQAYSNYRRLEGHIQNQYRTIVEQIVERMKERTHTQPTTSVFLTFETNHAKNLLCHLNTPKDTIFLTKNRLCTDSSNFTIKFQDEQFKTYIKEAPEPEDLIWTNIGQSVSQMVLRKLLTYSITAVILGGSFAIIFFLSREQVNNSNDAFLSFVISFSITVINIIIQIVIRALTNFEREETHTNFQSGLALKSIFAQVINSILLPFVVKYYIQENLYKVDGLAYVVFTMAITNSFLMPVLKLLNLGHLVFLIKAWFYKRISKKLDVTQSQLNQVNTLSEFEVGTQYIYPVNLYLFMCYYASLQPIICIFGIGGLMLMFWVQKHALFTRSRRPYPGSDSVNSAMYRVMYFGPVVFSLGNLTWSNLIKGGVPESALIPNLIAIGLSTLFALIPNRGFFSKIISEKYGQELQFEENRIYLTSQYDRLNPATSKAAMNQYYKFLREYKQKISKAAKEDIIKLQELLLTQKQKGALLAPKIAQLFEHVIGDMPEGKDPNEIMQQPSYKDNVSAEENHIMIKEDGIEQLKVNKKIQNRNVMTANKLFKSFAIGQQQRSSLNFVQNWLQEETQRNILDSLITDIKNDAHLSENRMGKNEEPKDGKKVQLKVQKKVQRKELSFNVLKAMLTNYQRQVKAGVKQEQQNLSKGSKIQDQNGISKTMNRHEDSDIGIAQTENQNNERYDNFLSMIINQGAAVIGQSTKK